MKRQNNVQKTNSGTSVKKCVVDKGGGGIRTHGNLVDTLNFKEYIIFRFGNVFSLF